MLKRLKSLFGIKQEKAKSTVYDQIDNLFDSLEEDLILVHIGNDLTDFGQLLCDITRELREEIKCECGFIIPNVHIKDNNILQENEFKIYIKGNLSENRFVIPNEDGVREEFYDAIKTAVYDNMTTLFTNEIAERYIDTAQIKNSRLIWNITSILSVSDIKIILSDIINLGKSINNIGYVFEKIGDKILVKGEYQEFSKKYNPHKIAKDIVRDL